MKSLGVACLLTLATAAPAQDAPVGSPAQQAPIRSRADLPPTAYKLSGKPSIAYSGQPFLMETLPSVRREAEQLLQSGRVEDPVIAQQLRAGLAAIAILQNRPADADRLIAAQRAADAKPQLRQVGLLLLDLAAANPVGTDCTAAAARLSDRLARAEPAVVRDELVARYGDVQTASLPYYAGAAAYMVDDSAAATGSIDLIDGLYMARWRVIAERIPPCRAALTPLFQAWLNAPANRAANIWPAREPDARLLAKAAPVTVAVWESGFDYGLFPGQLALDPAEPLDGKDNDGNGVVDDVHGPTYDANFHPVAGELPPLSPFLASRLGLQMAIEKGQLDLNYGEDSADARFFAARAREASAEEQTEDMLGTAEFLARTHGSWVASVIADGAPFVRLYALNAYPQGANPKPIPFVEEDAARWVALMPKLGVRLRGAGVRIVNMSWAFTVDNIRSGLIESGAEADPGRATERAKGIYTTLSGPLAAMIRDNPDILFIASAGNSNRTGRELAAIPQTLSSPNLLVVGATGSGGHPTSFTTFGDDVKLYALGEAVRVRVPGGMVMKASGTSFSGPMVARAAAAMLAVNPKLTPPQLIQGLQATSTGGDGGLRLLHSGQAVEWATRH